MRSLIRIDKRMTTNLQLADDQIKTFYKIIMKVLQEAMNSESEFTLDPKEFILYQKLESELRDSELLDMNT